MWMNQYDVEEMAHRYRDHEVAGPAALTVYSLMEWVNRNSDGWPYWQAPSKAANRLMDLLQDHDKWVRSEYRRPREGAEAALPALKKALVPLKSFRTKHADKGTFTIFTTPADIEAEVARREAELEAHDRATLARLQEKYKSA